MWLVVDKDGSEWGTDSLPKRDEVNSCWAGEHGDIVNLPEATIQKLIGKKLTWADEPLRFEKVTNPSVSCGDEKVQIDKVALDKGHTGKPGFYKVYWTENNYTLAEYLEQEDAYWVLGFDHVKHYPAAFSKIEFLFSTPLKLKPKTWYKVKFHNGSNAVAFHIADGEWYWRDLGIVSTDFFASVADEIIF